MIELWRPLPTPPRGGLWACSWLLASCMAKIGSLRNPLSVHFGITNSLELSLSSFIRIGY